MTPGADLARALTLLETNVLSHVVTLKMLHNHGASMSVRLVEGIGGWALLTYLPIEVSEWDRKTYPAASGVVFLDGTDSKAKLSLLHGLPGNTLVIKTGDVELKQVLDKMPGARKTYEGLSLTKGDAPLHLAPHADVIQATQLVDSASALFEANGYEPRELERYFADGATWFAAQRGGAVQSACFVYQNYGPVWEVAGVHTLAEFRGNGLAKSVVSAALRHLGSQDLIPRYITRSDNTASIGLAQSVGLVEFLRVNHYIVNG